MKILKISKKLSLGNNINPLLYLKIFTNYTGNKIIYFLKCTKDKKTKLKKYFLCTYL